MYEKIAKWPVEADMNKFLSPIYSAYRKNYSTQHDLVHLVEEWRERLENNYVAGSVFTDFSKAFDCISCDFRNSLFTGLFNDMILLLLTMFTFAALT